jgi:hypothetical protein
MEVDIEILKEIIVVLKTEIFSEALGNAMKHMRIL